MKRLIIVADHSLVVQAIRLALRQTAGFQVVGFVDGRRAAAATLAERTSPTSSSSTTCRSPSTRSPACARSARHVPDAKRAAAHAADGATSGSAEAFEAGAHAVLSKAVHPVALGTLLREVVARQRRAAPRARARAGPRPRTAR